MQEDQLSIVTGQCLALKRENEALQLKAKKRQRYIHVCDCVGERGGKGEDKGRRNRERYEFHIQGRKAGCKGKGLVGILGIAESLHQLSKKLKPTD